MDDVQEGIPTCAPPAHKFFLKESQVSLTIEKLEQEEVYTLFREGTNSVALRERRECSGSNVINDKLSFN